MRKTICICDKCHAEAAENDAAEAEQAFVDVNFYVRGKSEHALLCASCADQLVAFLKEKP